MWSQYLLTSTCASSAGLAIPLAMGRSGAAAWWIVPQARQPYLGRRIRRTRSRAGTKSSISLTVSPMTWSAPPQQGQTCSSISIATSSRGRWSGSPSRRNGGCELASCADADGWRACRWAISASRSSSPRASWSPSIRSERRPNCARWNRRMMSLSLSISACAWASSDRSSATCAAKSRTNWCSVSTSEGSAARSMSTHGILCESQPLPRDDYHRESISRTKQSFVASLSQPQQVATGAQARASRPHQSALIAAPSSAPVSHPDQRPAARGTRPVRAAW